MDQCFSYLLKDCQHFYHHKDHFNVRVAAEHFNVHVCIDLPLFEFGYLAFLVVKPTFFFQVQVNFGLFLCL